MIKLVMLIMAGVGCFVAVVVYWMLKPFESDLISTANTSVSVNMSNYPGYQATVNYWPWLGWSLLIILVGFLIYKVVTR